MIFSGALNDDLPNRGWETLVLQCVSSETLVFISQVHVQGGLIGRKQPSKV
jgi:hypothetical protein